MEAKSALNLVHEEIRRQVGEGAFCIDATAGRGNDTAFLCSLVGKSGRVIAFDVQKCALDSTAELLASKGYTAELIHASHAEMSSYAEPLTADCIVFNLGWLPGGDHSLFTRAESSIRAIESGLKILKRGGLMCVSVYSGGASGYDERDTLLPLLKTLDSDEYQVLVTTFHNWKGDPPIPVFIYKL